MNNPMHTEIFDYYSLTHLSEKDKRSIRKTINKYYKKLYGSKKWNELTDTQRRDFKITTMRSYLLGKILYPDKDKKTRPTTRAKEKVSKIEKK